MYRRRLGQILIAGVVAACALVTAALVELVSKEDAALAQTTAETQKTEAP